MNVSEGVEMELTDITPSNKKDELEDVAMNPLQRRVLPATPTVASDA